LPPLPPTAAVAPETFSKHIIPLPSRPSVEELLADVPEPTPSAWGWFILPLVWGNRLFDLGTLSLGESGNWLRGPGGRSLLGATGLILMAVACLWLMRDWLGWTW
jgi:hypothetical protein